MASVVSRFRGLGAPLVSNATFLVAGRYLITGDDFTAEPDALDGMGF